MRRPGGKAIMLSRSLPERREFDGAAGLLLAGGAAWFTTAVLAFMILAEIAG